MKIKLLGALIGSLLFSQLLYSQTKALPTKTVLNAQPAVAMDSAAIAKGKRLYNANCLSCHNRDPNLKGSIGPEVVEAPLPVMYSKIMTGKYPDPLPAGFIPKRKSRAMRALPKLKEDIPAIWAYVQSVKKKK